MRLLGIPTVMDRLIQQAVHQILSPLWEPEFSTYSFGFRPHRSAAHALEQATAYINEGYQDIIDLDLKSFFDRVNHDKLMGIIRKKIKDVPLLRLIRRFLQSGIMLGGVEQAREEGTPQGGAAQPVAVQYPVPAEHSEEELGCVEAQNQSADAQNRPCATHRTHRQTEPADAGLGELLQTGHGLREV